MQAAQGQDVPPNSRAKKWAAEYRLGRESLEDDLCPARPDTVTTQETMTWS